MNTSQSSNLALSATLEDFGSYYANRTAAREVADIMLEVAIMVMYHPQTAHPPLIRVATILHLGARGAAIKDSFSQFR
jgi:hypothetical protein